MQIHMYMCQERDIQDRRRWQSEGDVPAAVLIKKELNVSILVIQIDLPNK
jgi:hypothetical protein